MSDPYIVIEWQETSTYTTRVRQSELVEAVGDSVIDLSNEKLDQFLGDRSQDDFESCTDRMINYYNTEV